VKNTTGDLGFGKCQKCKKEWAIVGMNDGGVKGFFCAKCFDKALGVVMKPARKAAESYRKAKGE
jgi:hypothetical protein